MNQIDEREDVQKKTFGKWINSQLAKANAPLVTDLFYDLRDGTRLLALLSLLTGRSFVSIECVSQTEHLSSLLGICIHRSQKGGI